MPLFLSIAMFSQEQSNDMEEAIPSKLEQLIIDIESEIDEKVVSADQIQKKDNYKTLENKQQT